MEIKQILRGVELFEGLNEEELEAVVRLCEERRYNRDDIIAQQGAPGEEFFIINNGFVEVVVETPNAPRRVIVNLGVGQTVGEMSLVDRGPRSATVRAISEPTVVQVIRRDGFVDLCENNTRIGYVVLRNIAADLSFRLRQRHLSDIRG